MSTSHSPNLGEAGSRTLRGLRAAWRAGSARLSWTQWLVVIVAVAGVGVLQYPAAASWFSSRVHAGQVESYGEVVEGLPAEEVSALLEDARDYNEWLPKGPLRDPFKPDGVAQETAVGDYVEEYFEKLAVPGDDAMARLSIPSIGVDLPVRHGTDPRVLASGVGHLFGSSLPVGGVGTHSVMTAHSGFVGATLFDDLHLVERGDVIVVQVLGESLYYEVDQILEVLPNEADSLQVDAEKDYITLITCTPTGVNTHRLLVRAERIDGPAAEEAAADVTVPDKPVLPGFPWWAVIILATAAGAYSVVRLTSSEGADELEGADEPEA